MISSLVQNLSGLNKTRNILDVKLYEKSIEENVDNEKISTNIWFKCCFLLKTTISGPISLTSKEIIKNYGNRNIDD